jgi:hypothetical protein
LKSQDHIDWGCVTILKALRRIGPAILDPNHESVIFFEIVTSAKMKERQALFLTLCAKVLTL